MNDTPQPKPPITWWAGLIVFALVIILLTVLSAAVTTLLVAVGAGPDTVALLATPIGIAIQVIVVSVFFTAVSLAVPRLSGVSMTQGLGLGRPRALTVVFALVGVVGIGFLVDELTFLLHSLSPDRFPADGLAMFNETFVQASPAVFVLLTLAVTVGPGVGEELLFRGLLLRSFLGGLPPITALTLSSALFGAIHLNMLQGTGAGVIGLYLGAITLSSRSIWPAVAAHAFNNFICSMFARFGGDISSVWKDGHPLWLLCAAAAVFGVGLFGVARTSRHY